MPDWFVPVMISGYIAMVALIAWGIVRLWQVWDDARTILLTLFLLFAVLALSLDQFAIQRPQAGVTAMMVSWCFAIAVSEGLLFALRLRLPALYRLSLHGQLALMFLYPLLLIPGTRASNNELTTWLLLAFSALIAVPLLILWPAVRRGRQMLSGAVAPWPWPWYPWAIPTLLSAILLGRSYSLCLTFDSVPTLTADEAYGRLPSVFGGYFAMPLLFAAGVLILEAALRSGRRGWQRAALGMPFGALGLCLVAEPQNSAAVMLMQRMAEAIGSPLWIGLWLAIGFYAIAAWRRVPLANRGLLISLMLLTAASPRALTWSDLTPPPAWAWGLAAAIVMCEGAWRRHSLPWYEAGLYGVIAVWQSPWFAGPIEPVLILHALLIWTVVVSAVCDDRPARFLRELGSYVLWLWTIWAVIVSLHPHEAWWMLPGGIAVMASVTGFVWWLRRLPEYLALVIALCVATYGSSYVQGAFALHRQLHWVGLPAFAWGLALLHIGLAVSAAKGIAHRRIRNRAPA
jgi:hypothetical protein